MWTINIDSFRTVESKCRDCNHCSLLLLCAVSKDCYIMIRFVTASTKYDNMMCEI